jgi:hypothetical protein
MTYRENRKMTAPMTAKFNEAVSAKLNVDCDYIGNTISIF